MRNTDLEDLLLEAMTRRQCPICGVLDALVFDELCQLQLHAVTDAETHAAVVARGGYCAEHFWYLVELASPVTNARLLAPLIDRVAERATACANAVAIDAALPRQGAVEIATRLGVPANCLVCEHVAAWETAAIEALRAIVGDPARWPAYANSDGACLPHLSRLVVMSHAPALARALLQVAANQAAQLADDLRVYVRKHESLDRRRGPEDGSPSCTVQKLVGARRRALRNH
ncbi:MAG TPA: DUF6062 family protein [Candidatus Kryptonia bacterium]|nr:DUF6062 family protein [Candidatus Kryptonia bacterium]